MNLDLKKISIEGDTFEDLKVSFDEVMTRVLRDMETKGAEDASVTIKVSIELQRMVDDGTEAGYVLVPRFKHDVSSAMNIKNKVSGSVKGDYELVYNDADGRYMLRPNQISMF